LRLTRGLSLALVCTLLACAGHLASGGGAPSPPALLAVAALLGSGFVVLADKRRGFGQVLSAALGAQPLFHLAFSLTGHASPGAALHTAGAVPAGPVPEPPSVGVLLLPGIEPSMIAGHVVAAAVVAWLVADGESVLWALVDLFARFFVPLPAVASVGCHRPVPYLGTADLTVRRGRLFGVLHTRRGPPE